MNEHSKPSPKPGRNRRGTHSEPSRLEQIEDALHRLSKKVGKLNRERKDMKVDYESELAALKETRAALAAEVTALRKIRAALEGEVGKMGEQVEAMAGDDDPDKRDPPD